METMELLNDGQPMTQEQAQQIQQQDQLNQQSEVLTSDFGRFYTEEEFYNQFKSIFQFAGDRTGLESLPIKESEERGARITANRIYEMAEKYAFLNFLIDKTTSRLAETILMIQFLAFKSADVYKEKANRSLGGDLWQKIKRIIKRRKGTLMDRESESLEPQEVGKRHNQEN